MARRRGRRIEYQLWLDNRLRPGLQDAQQQMYYFSRSVGGMSARASGVIGSLATGNAALIGTAFTAAAIGATWQLNKFAADFENRWAEVTTLVPEMSDRMTDQLRSQMQGLSEDYAVSQKTLTQGYYDAISAGVQVGDMLQFQANAARLARGGIIQHDVAVRLLAQHMNAYGTGVNDTQRISDIFFATMRKGVTTVGQLSRNMHNVTPIAAELNITLEETGALMATLTKLGAPTDIAATRIGALMVELMRTGQKADLYFRRASNNQGLREFIEAGHGLADVVYLMDELRREENKEWAEIFSRKEATLAAANIASKEGRRIQEENLAATQNAAGSTELAYEKMADTTQFKLDQISVAWEDLKIEVGESAAGITDAVLGMIMALELGVNTLETLINKSQVAAILRALGGEWDDPFDPSTWTGVDPDNAFAYNDALGRLGGLAGRDTAFSAIGADGLPVTPDKMSQQQRIDLYAEARGISKAEAAELIRGGDALAWDIARQTGTNLDQEWMRWNAIKGTAEQIQEAYRTVVPADDWIDPVDAALAAGVAPGAMRRPGEGDRATDEQKIRDAYMLETMSPARWLAYLERELAKVSGGAYDERERSLLYEIKAVKDAIDKASKKAEDRDREFKVFLDVATEEGVVVKSDQLVYGIRKAVTGGRQLVQADRPLS